MRSNWFPDGVGCIEENQGTISLLRQSEPTEVQEVQVQRLGRAHFFPRGSMGRESQAGMKWCLYFSESSR